MVKTEVTDRLFPHPWRRVGEISTELRLPLDNFHFRRAVGSFDHFAILVAKDTVAICVFPDARRDGFCELPARGDFSLANSQWIPIGIAGKPDSHVGIIGAPRCGPFYCVSNLCFVYFVDLPENLWMLLGLVLMRLSHMHFPHGLFVRSRIWIHRSLNLTVNLLDYLLLAGSTSFRQLFVSWIFPQILHLRAVFYLLRNRTK